MRVLTAVISMAMMVMGMVLSINYGPLSAPADSDDTAIGEEAVLSTPVEHLGAGNQSPVTSQPNRQQALDITGRLSHGTVASTSFDELFVEVGVQASQTLPEQRPPLNLALVIDRSGSMNGEPMQRAREAARTFVDGLDGDDQIALVAFDSRADLLLSPTAVTDAGRARIHGAIDTIYAGGATNISDGIDSAHGAIAEWASDERVNRIVLLTDGNPTEGIVERDGLAGQVRAIRQQGISMSTLGFGTNYDARLMVAMADEGTGNFHHISTGADMEIAFGEELQGLRETVASGIELELRPRPGVNIERVIGFKSEPFAGGQRVVMGDVAAGNRLNAVLKVSVGELPQGSDRPLVDVVANYNDRLHGGAARFELALAADVTADRRRAQDSINKEVMARVEQLRTQDAIMEIMAMYERGDQQGATRRLEQEQQRVQRARREYEIDADAEPTRRVDAVMDKVGSAVRGLAPNSSAGREAANEVQEVSVEVYRGR